MKKELFVFAVITGVAFAASAAESLRLKSNLTSGKEDAALFTDVDQDGDPDILERWWNGKRCRWIDENDDMKTTDQRGDMVGDSMQVDIDGDGLYDGPSDMNINWVDNDRNGQADLMCVAMNPNAKQKDLWGGSSHYMYFLDVDGDGVNHYINWKNFSFDSWRHTGGCNFSPDYNGDSLFIKTHLPPWALSDARFNWENPFAFYDFDDDGCTEMAVRYLNHHVKTNEVHTYSGFAGTVQIGFDLDNDSQRGQEQSFDMSLGFDGSGVDYRNRVNKFAGQKAPAWVLPYFQHKNYRQIDELIFMPHELCFDEAMRGQWNKARFVFDEDNDDHRWERVEFYEPGDPYLPRPPKGENNNSVVRNTQTDALGDRAEWDQDFSGKGRLYIGPWDNKLHLYGAESGVWLVDDGTFFGSGSAPRVSSPNIASKVKEVVQYNDTDNDGFFDRITYDYDGDKTVDLEVSLVDYGMKAPALITPATEKWQGLHETFMAMAKRSWADAQMLYRAAWRAGLTDAELEELAIASSTWEKYDHGYWLKEKLFRKLHKQFENNAEKQKALKRAYFTRDFDAMVALITGVSVSSAEAQKDKRLSSGQEATHFSVARTGVLFHRPEGMPKPGPYYTCLVKMDGVAGFPFDYALYFSTDHNQKGGIWLYLCKGVPSEARNWKSYDQAVANGDFDYLKVKPEKNPVFLDTVQGSSSETPHANVIGGKVYMTYHNVLDSRLGQATLLATSPDGINFSRIHGADDSAILKGANHTGYFRWASNRFSGIKHEYVGYSLYGGGADFRSALWVSDDAIHWKRDQILRPLEGHAMPEADKILIWHGMDPNSITPLGNGKYVALCAGGSRASGSMPRVVELYEIFLADDGKTLAGESRKVMKQGAAGSDDAEETAEPTTALIGDTWHVIYVGAKNQGKENTVMSATGKLDQSAGASPELSNSDRQRHFDGK